MASKSLIDKIDGLGEKERAKVEDFVDSLANRTSALAQQGAFSDELLARIAERQARLLRERGLFDSVPILKDLREAGGR
jgi:hypothetical protein